MRRTANAEDSPRKHENTKDYPSLFFVLSWFRGLSLIVALGLCAVGCSSPDRDDRDYATKIAADRASKDASFAATDDPIPRARHAEFLPLAYFPIDPEYNVPAVLKPTDDTAIVEMPTSTGGADKFRRAGTLEFALKGQSLQLTAFVPASATTV